MLTLFDDWPKDYEDQFWAAFPRRVSKIPAMKALAKIRAGGNVKFPDLMAAVERYKVWLSQRDGATWRPEPKHPATWLNGGCWADELDGGYHAETVATAATSLADQGFSFGPRPRGLHSEAGSDHGRLLPKR